MEFDAAGKLVCDAALVSHIEPRRTSPLAQFATIVCIVLVLPPWLSKTPGDCTLHIPGSPSPSPSIQVDIARA
jgi:hypothetical protein